MIYLLTGENDYEITDFVNSIKSGFDGAVSYVDDNTVNIDIKELLTGQTLFSENKLIIFKNISKQSEVWHKLPSYLEQIDKDMTIIIIENSPDKRKTSYKEIIKLADTKTYNNYDYKTISDLKKWLLGYCSRNGIAIDANLAAMLIDRVGYDQWAIVNALNKLELAGGISKGTLEEQVENNLSENIFQLLDFALNNKIRELRRSIDTLKTHEDAYKTMGLISSQLLLVVALKNNNNPENVARDFGASIYMLSKLRPTALNIKQPRLRKAVKLLVTADKKMKSISEDPWTYLDQALMKIASVK